MPPDRPATRAPGGSDPHSPPRDPRAPATDGVPPGAAESDVAVRLRVLFRRAALAAGALTFVVIVASAFMRHTQAGLACDDWPACYGRVESSASMDSARTEAAPLAPGAQAVPSSGVRIARVAHRLAATGVLALVIGLLLVAWTQKPAWTREGRLAAAALVTAGTLAALGVATPGAQMPAVTLGNLLGGYVMLALLTALWAAAGARPDAQRGRRSRVTPLVITALALLFVQSALGGAIGAQYALTACPTMGSCPGLPFDPFVGSGAFDPFRPLASSAGRVVPPADAAALHILHRVLGIATSFVMLVVAFALRRTDGAAFRLLAAGAIVAPLAGAAAILAMPSLPFTVLHNAAAALAIATLAAAWARR